MIILFKHIQQVVMKKLTFIEKTYSEKGTKTA